MEQNNILEAHDLCKRFGTHTALEGVSIDVPQGSVYGLLGPNGAGKTTLIRIINHITAPDAGKVVFKGKPLTQESVAYIGYLPEERGLYKKMKVGEQAIFLARLKGLSRYDATRELKQWFDKFEIGSWWDRKVEELSKGMAQKVQFIVTVLHRPDLLIFDEPFSGFDPINAELLKREVLELSRQGATIIFSTHNMASVEEICQHITLINQGRNILTGNVEELRRQYSTGRYGITFSGCDPNTFAGALNEYVQEVNFEAAPYHSVTAHMLLRPEASVRQVIDAANRTADIRSMGEAVVSMNKIFISAVNSTKK